MNDFLILLRPHRWLFAGAIVALLLSAFFTATMTGLISPLMNDVMTDQAETQQSRTDKIFQFKEKMEDIKNWLIDVGLPLEKIEDHASGPDLTNPIPWAILVFVVFLFQASFEFLGSYMVGRVGLLVVVDMRQNLIDHVLNLPLRFFKHFSTGEVLARINADVQRVQQAISVKLGELVKSCTNCAMFTVLAFVLHWKLSLTLFILVPVIALPIVWLTKSVRKYAKRSQSFLGTLNAHLKEVLVGVRIVKGFQREGYESNKLRTRNQSFLKYALRELRILAMTTPIMGLIGMLIILTFVAYGGFIIQSGTMTKGDFFFYVLVIYSLYQPIKRIARANSEIQQAVGVLPRIREIMDWQNDIPEPTHPQRFDQYPDVQEIRFDKVSFTYSDANNGPLVLRDIDLTVKQGDVVALVGSSGSGKSTLVNLLPRFYDVQHGSITINGLDIRHMCKHDLRALSAIVTQDTILFDDTVHNNIAYGMDNISRADVVAAATKAHAHGFIEQLAEGYDTVIGESGGNLSGGQRQRISIARAILKDSPILILDEATSALDTESEREVQAALDNLMTHKTAFVIAHRLSTIRRADSILVMSEGAIVERGDHGSLMRDSGHYARLIELQKEGQDAF